MDTVVEICCGSFYDAKQAYLGGAKRIELNSALHLGGLTPSIASLELTKKELDLKVIAMLRPRGAGFCYCEDDFEVMKRDCELLMEYNADGIAFGFLNQLSQIDVERTKQIVEIVKKHSGETVFHRAFDCVDNPFTSIEKLIDLGIDRVLTSGLKSKAVDGMELIKQLQQKYGDRIELLAGSGINYSNAKDILDFTGIHQVHSSCKDWVDDSTTSSNGVSYSYADEPHAQQYDVVSKDLVQRLMQSVN